MKPRRKNPSRPSGGFVIPPDATASDRRKVAFDYPEEDHVVDYVNDLGSGEHRRLLIQDGRWQTEIFPLGSSTPEVRRFLSRDAASHHIHHQRQPAHRNPDWHALAASAKDKAKRAHEWSKPHARKVWEAAKVGAKRAGAATKRGSKKLAGSLAGRLQRYAVANPDPRQDTPESYGLDATDAVIRRRVAEEASTARGHMGLALAHRAMARTFASRGWHGWADYRRRMADAHESMAHALAGVAAARRR